MSAAEPFEPVVMCLAELSAYSRGPGISTIPLVNKRRGAKVFLNGMTLFEPGTGIALHTHNCPESVVILEGQAIAEIDGEEHLLSTWDATYVDTGMQHCFRNASRDHVLRILWTYGSADATRTIVATGVTTRVDEEGS